MPTYSYQCKKCGKVQDEFHSITANPRIKCNKCGGPCKRKLGSGAGIIFKGSGFYETDYKRAGAKGGDGKSSESKSESKSSSSDKGGSKPSGSAAAAGA